MEQNTTSPDLDDRLAARLAQLRQEQGWSLDELAARSGVSKATLSRLERGETSPTASLLGRLCTAYGRTMSRLLAEVESQPVSLLHPDQQPVWIDPGTGFHRRAISPPASGFDTELIEGTLPPGTVIDYAAPPVHGLEQHVWMLSGRLELALQGLPYRLETGDCLRFRLFGTSRFTVLGEEPARYLIAITRP